MTFPSGDNVPLHDLELIVSQELSEAETSLPEEEAVRVPVSEWLSDPADEERYEVRLGSLLEAVEALEGSALGGHLPSTEVSDGFGPSNGREG